MNGLIKISASGIQDTRLTKAVPTADTISPVIQKNGRYTTRWERLNFEGTPQFGQQATAEIPVKGHLLTKLYLVANLPDIYASQDAAAALAEAAGATFIGPTFGWTNSTGHALVEEATIDIGGKPIERLESRLLEILDEYNTPLEQLTTVNDLLMRDMTAFTTESGRANKVVVPLPFWFTRDPAVALPVDAINADIIRVRMQFRGLAGMYYTDSRAAAASALWTMTDSKFYSTGTSMSAPTGLATTELTVDELATTMPISFSLGDTYLLAEYVYLDKAEANRFRIADIEIPIVQHVALPVVDTQGAPRINVDLAIPNPVRALYWMAQRQDAAALNAHFFAARDSAAGLWPDASPLTENPPMPIPAWRFRESEPFTQFSLTYDGYIRWRTETPQLYRSFPHSTKTPYINRYYYMLPFSNMKAPISAPVGEANFNKIQRQNFYAEFVKTQNPAPINVYIWAETFNVLKVYGGRAGLLF